MSDERSVPQRSVHWYELVSAQLDGALSEEEQDLFDRLVREHAEFSEEYRSFQRLQQILAEYREQLPPAPPTLLQSVMEHVKRVCTPVCTLEEVVEYVDGVASEDVRFRIEQRMASDAAFRQEVLEYKALSKLLANTAVSVGDGFTEAVLRSLPVEASGAEKPGRSFLSRVLESFLRPAWIPRYAAVALAVVLLISGWLVTSPRWREDAVLRSPAPPSFDGERRELTRSETQDRLYELAQPDEMELWHAPLPPAVGRELLDVAWQDFEQLRAMVEAYGASGVMAQPSTVALDTRHEFLRRFTLPREAMASKAAKPAAEEVSEWEEKVEPASESEGPPPILEVSGYVGSMVAWKGDDDRLHCAVIVDMEIARETIRVLCQRYNVGLEKVRAQSAGQDASEDGPAGPEGELVVLDLPRSAANSLLRDIAQRLAAAESDPARVLAADVERARSGPGAGGGARGQGIAGRAAPAEGRRHHPAAAPRKKQQVYRGIAVELPRTRVDRMRRFLSSLQQIRPWLERVVRNQTARYMMRPLKGPWGTGQTRRGAPAPDPLDTTASDGEDRVRVFLYLIDKADRIPAAPPSGKAED